MLLGITFIILGLIIIIVTAANELKGESVVRKFNILLQQMTDMWTEFTWTTFFYSIGLLFIVIGVLGILNA